MVEGEIRGKFEDESLNSTLVTLATNNIINSINHYTNLIISEKLFFSLFFIPRFLSFNFPFSLSLLSTSLPQKSAQHTKPIYSLVVVYIGICNITTKIKRYTELTNCLDTQQNLDLSFIRAPVVVVAVVLLIDDILQAKVMMSRLLEVFPFFCAQIFCCSHPTFMLVSDYEFVDVDRAEQI